jgi:hypothetical protein
MKRLGFTHVLIATAVMVVASAGCQKKSTKVETTDTSATPVQRTPQESFDAVIESFRRSVEEIPIGFVVQDSSGGQTMMTGRNTVSYELLTPQKEGEPFKAKITVTSDTQYSLQRSPEKPEADDSNQSQDSADEASSNDSDVQIFDPAVASAPGGPDRRTTTGKIDTNAVTVARTANKLERYYELVHENGRWKLVTKLDPNTEESIKLAFDRALASQS